MIHFSNCGNILFCLNFSPACSIEIPERLSAPFDKLKQYGLVERCIQLPVREAIEEEIILVHRLDIHRNGYLHSPSLTLHENLGSSPFPFLTALASI